MPQTSHARQERPYATTELHLVAGTTDPNLDISQENFGLPFIHGEVNLKYVNTLAQMRGEIDDGGGMDDLKRSIRELDGLVNEPIYALLSPEATQKYIDVTNTAWGTDNRLADMTPWTDGRYFVVVAGHRRTRAMKEICEEDGDTGYEKMAPAKIIVDATPHDILSLQLAENVVVAPPPDRYAIVIHEIYSTGRAAGVYASVADFIRHSPLGEGRVRAALRFMELPGSIQSLCHAGKLSYGKSVVLHQLIGPYKAYLERYPNLVPAGQTVHELVEERLLMSAQKILGERMGMDQAKKYVQGCCAQYEPDIENDLGRLFDASADEDAEAYRRRKVAKITETLRFAGAGVVASSLALEVIPNSLHLATTEERARLYGQLCSLRAALDVVIKDY